MRELQALEASVRAIETSIAGLKQFITSEQEALPKASPAQMHAAAAQPTCMLHSCRAAHAACAEMEHASEVAALPPPAG